MRNPLAAGVLLERDIRRSPPIARRASGPARGPDGDRVA